MKRIYKTFWGRHIDLSKITSISEARLMKNDNYYSDHKQVVFDIYFELMDNPVIYKRGLSWSGQPVDRLQSFQNDEALYTYNGNGCFGQTPKKNEQGEYVAVISLQKQIDSLINDWKEYINNPE